MSTQSPFRPPAAAREAATRIRLSGAEGLRSMPGGMMMSADEPASFYGELSRLDLNVTVVSVFTATAHRAIYRPQGRPPSRAGSVSVILPTSGVLDVEVPDGRVEVVPGSLLLLRSGERFAYRTPGTVRVIAATARYFDLSGRDTATPALLAPTRLNTGFAAMLRQFCAAPFTRADERGNHVERVLLELLRGVVAQQLEQDHEEADLGRRIRRLIDANLSDPRLGPRTIAESLGISVRLVHHAFNVDDVTVARYIKHRRLDRVADLLRESVGTAGTDDLVAAVGYAGRSQLSRAFHERFGTTISAFRAESVVRRPDGGEAATAL